MLEQAKEIFEWLEQGAHFYVCGDAKRMASDVDNALKQIVAEQGGMSAEEASAYVANLVKANRYQRDVY
jgi:sulfite reductase (NADPH) flavoprotein alpha-component